MQSPAFVYQEADFDSPVIETLKRGQVFTISIGKKGPFHKIRLQPGRLGWIADTDVKPGVHKIAVAENDKKKPERRKNLPYHRTRYRAVAMDFIRFTEDTVGGEQSEFMNFFGAKFYGENTLMSGEIYTESNVLFAPAAPKYYEGITGRGANGFIFLMNFLFQTASPVGKNAMTFYGFGPMFRYSHFNLEVPDGARSLNYAADDMAVGALFNFGVGTRWKRVSVRGDAKYYWEQKQYYGLGLSVGLDF